MPFAPINGIELFYEIHGPPVGEAPALVFAHGAGGNHLSWWQQVAHFRATHTCVTFDHRCFGHSRDVPDGPGGAAYVDDLLALLDHLGIGRPDLVAQSMGGWTCLGLALREPARVRRLVMSDTHGGLRGPGIDWRAATAAAAPVPPGVHRAVGARCGEEQPALTFLYNEIGALNIHLGGEEQLGAIIRAAGAPTVDDLAGFATPTLFIIGEEDIVIPPLVLEAAAKLVPGAQVAHVPRSGHSVYFERAAEYNAIVERFLRE